MDQNSGKVSNSYGTVSDNSEKIVINYEGGTVTTNKGTGTIGNIHGSVSDNYGTIANNFSSGTVTTNEGTVTINKGNIETNAAGGTVTENYGTVTDNYGTVNNFELGGVTGRVTNNYGTEIGTEGEARYGIVVNDTDNQGKSALVQFIQGISQDLKMLFTRENYVLKGYEEGEEQTESTEYTAQKPGTIRLIWEKLGTGETSGDIDSGYGNAYNGNDSAVPLSYSYRITYLLGSKEDISTGIRANGEKVQILFMENVLRDGSDFFMDGDEIFLKAKFLETLKEGNYTFCIDINGMQTWILLTVC